MPTVKIYSLCKPFDSEAGARCRSVKAPVLLGKLVRVQFARRPDFILPISAACRPFRSIRQCVIWKPDDTNRLEFSLALSKARCYEDVSIHRRVNSTFSSGLALRMLAVGLIGQKSKRTNVSFLTKECWRELRVFWLGYGRKHLLYDLQSRRISYSLSAIKKVCSCTMMMKDLVI